MAAALAQGDLFGAASSGDWLGEAYCRENDASVRREHGITLTPAWLVEAMIGALRADEFDTVVDCGAGTSRFALAAAVRWPRARVVAVERHPRVAGLLRQRVAEAGLRQRIAVVEADFRTVELSAGGRTLYLGNPPYVRHHDIESEWKNWYAHGMAVRGVRASQLAGLHAHFVLAAAQRMQEGDKLCFVTAAEWLDNGYGKALRQLLTAADQAPQLEGLWVADAGQPVFDDALVSTVVFTADSGRRGAGSVALGKLAERQLQTVRHSALDAVAQQGRWTSLCRPQPAQSASGIEVGELFQVVRGQVTGANEVFVLPRGDQSLPDGLTCAAVTRAKEIIDGEVLSADGVARLKRVVNLPADLDRLDASARAMALQFIGRARALGADRGYVARSRRPWYAVAMRRPPAAFVSYMGRRPPVFAANPFGVSYLNIAHGLYPRQPVAEPTLRAILDHLNQHTGLGDGRVYGGGLAKFEPSDIARLRVPVAVLEAAA